MAGQAVRFGGRGAPLRACFAFTQVNAVTVGANTRNIVDISIDMIGAGSRACASVVASVLNDLTSRTVDVRLRGGVLRIEWNEKDNRVYLTGPAREVFSGLYHYM